MRFWICGLVPVIVVFSLMSGCDTSDTPQVEVEPVAVVENLDPLPPTTADPIVVMPVQPLSGPIKIISRSNGRDVAFRIAAKKVISDDRELDGMNVQSLSNIDIDFSNHSLVLLAMGEQFSDYQLRIATIDREGYYLIVRAEGTELMHQPENDHVNKTYPFCTAVIPRTDAVEVISELFLE